MNNYPEMYMFILAFLKWNILQNNCDMKNKAIMINTKWSLVLDHSDWEEWICKTYI